MYLVVATDSNFVTTRTKVNATSKSEAKTLCPTTGSYDRIINLDAKLPARKKEIGSIISTKTLICGTWVEEGSDQEFEAKQLSLLLTGKDY